MNDEKGAKLNFLPVFGKWLGVAMKAVTADKQMHLGLSGSPVTDLSTDGETIVRFYQPVKDPNRITVHFFRDRKNSSLPLSHMAAGRMNEKQSFGFSLQDCDKSPDKKQQFLQLAFLVKDLGKSAGFEALYIKMELPPETGISKPIYLKITLREKMFKEGNGFLLRAEEVPEASAPAHLQKALTWSEVQTTQS